MVRLNQGDKGNYRARKRLPNGVREESDRLYGPRTDVKFYAPASVAPLLARRLYSEWLAQTEGQIADIRDQRNGEGVSLTHREARALQATVARTPSIV